MSERTRRQREDTRLGWSLVPLRLFLGLTFIYGGIQKFSDPGFFHPGAPTYIGTQLRGFARGTPGGFLLRAFAIPHPSLSGAGVALLEIMVGLLVTTGLLTRPAARVGLLLNFVLFTTNSWRTYPYFLGSDIVFVFAWSPFALIGAAGQPTLEPVLRRIVDARARAAPSRDRGAVTARDQGAVTALDEATVTRRGAIRAVLAGAAVATGAIATVSLLLRGGYRSPQTLSASAPRRSASPPARSTRRSSRGGRPTGSAARRVPPGAAKLGSGRQLPPDHGATYTDPGDGQPDIVIRLADGSLVAHSAVCTHAGCTVNYEGGQIVCPCHGSAFNARTGAAITGPAVAPLASRKVIQYAGEIYALPA
jgi:thiosulfate dehydrogenase (quinone) large subunit